MSTYCSYDLVGTKAEFANWVSDISPEYTPFISMLNKFNVQNTMFQWQTDSLSAATTAHNYVEGSDAASVTLTPTEIKSNYTQIMRKVVMVSDTANAVSSHGREKELFYQLKKAAKELKRDNEAIFLLEAQAGSAGTASAASKTASLGKLIDPTMVVMFEDATFEDALFEATAKLFTEGAEADMIMYHPGLASRFAALQEKSGTRQRIFENDKRFVKQVEYIVDPLGQEFKCVPNRWLEPGLSYILNMKDVGMAVLRAPQQIALAKTGSSQKYMIEQEVGLRLNNPKSALIFKAAPAEPLKAPVAVKTK